METWSYGVRPKISTPASRIASLREPFSEAAAADARPADCPPEDRSLACLIEAMRTIFADRQAQKSRRQQPSSPPAGRRDPWPTGAAARRVARGSATDRGRLRRVGLATCARAGRPTAALLRRGAGCRSSASKEGDVRVTAGFNRMLGLSSAPARTWCSVRRR
jgi:hypothetical protein